jgi:hypothetical protein
MKEILISVGILGSLILVAYFLPFDPCSEIMQKTIVIAKVFLALGVILAAFQFYFNQQQLKNNNSWNKSQLAITEINKINTKLEPSIKKLRKELEYGERKEPYKVSELHDKFGKFEDNGKKFVFYKNDENKNDENKKFSDGRDIKDTIINLLNNFEYIATGVNLGIFDETVTKKLWKSKLVYAYKMFENYINHLRIEHDWKNVYIEMEKLAKKWEKEN